MRLICCGVEHSGTRWVTGLLYNHPDVAEVHHISFPSGQDGVFVDLKKWISDKNFEDEIKNIVVVTRDKSCNTKSIEKQSGAIKNKNRIIKESPCDDIFDACLYNMNKTLSELEDINIFYISYESLLQQKDGVLKQTFKLLRLDVDKYDFKFKGKIKKGWFEVDSVGRDGNKKYVK